MIGIVSYLVFFTVVVLILGIATLGLNLQWGNTGLFNAGIVVTRDVVMVVSKDRAQDVKKIVDEVKRRGRSEATSHTVVHRPWGSYQTVDSDAFQWSPLIKLIEAGGGGSANLPAEWNAKLDFSGPKEETKPLSAWEKFAQVLLMSNELVFVD